MTCRGWAALVAATLLSSPLVARAFPDYVGSRALGMAGAGRADARGGEGPLLNPAGMSLGRLYTVEGGYQYLSDGGGHLGHVSAVDSTSAANLAGGLYYTYRTAAGDAGFSRFTGHEGGLSLAYPLGDHLLVGATGKYFHVSGGPTEPDGGDRHSGFTADAGAIVRAGSMLSLGVVGYNLRDLSTVRAPVAVGYGLAFTPIPDGVLAIDGLQDFTTSDRTRGVRTTWGAGGEYMFQKRVVVRVGGGHDGTSDHGFLTAGFAAVSELGAVDLGFRRDVTGDPKLTFFAAGLRLFVPQP